MIDDYTRLLETTAELGDKSVSEAAVTKLIVHLKSTGRMKMLPKIAGELRKVAARRYSLRARVEVAHRSEEAAALRAAAARGIDVSHASVNTSLISGWRARERGRLIDCTAKQALLNIYQKVTS